MPTLRVLFARNKLPTDNVFQGMRADGKVFVSVNAPNGACWNLELFLHVRNHSPDGFNWGYGGSGPAQLALAILMEVSGSPVIAEALHQRFKWQFVAKLADEWSIHEGFVREWILDNFDLEKFEAKGD